MVVEQLHFRAIGRSGEHMYVYLSLTFIASGCAHPAVHAQSVILFYSMLFACRLKAWQGVFVEWPKATPL